jgi:hypothetical protein
MTFTSEQVAEFAAERAAIEQKYYELLGAYAAHGYRNSRAREFAMQGFCRRLKTLMRCVRIVFDKLPPDRDDLPSEDDRTDGAIALQAFVFNLFGSIDNLAWIWVLEKSVTKADGSNLSPSKIGLGPKNVEVRASLPVAFRVRLEALRPWFENLENYRHALAHRIPLYIPPYVVRKSDELAYRDLIKRLDDAFDRDDRADYERLLSDQEKLVQFSPYIAHSFEERSMPIAFHPQLLADFNTLVEIADGMKRAI